jgi:hypothetical protein
MFYQNASSDYYEYTMIGNALTELYRLESVSHTNCINYFTNTFYDALVQKDVEAYGHSGSGAGTPQWTLMSPESIQLKGITYNQIQRIKSN